MLLKKKYQNDWPENKLRLKINPKVFHNLKNRKKDVIQDILICNFKPDSPSKPKNLLKKLRKAIHYRTIKKSLREQLEIISYKTKSSRK